MVRLTSGSSTDEKLLDTLLSHVLYSRVKGSEPKDAACDGGSFTRDLHCVQPGSFVKTNTFHHQTSTKPVERSVDLPVWRCFPRQLGTESVTSRIRTQAFAAPLVMHGIGRNASNTAPGDRRNSSYSLAPYVRAVAEYRYAAATGTGNIQT